MKEKYILAIDQGSTSTKVILVDKRGSLAGENEVAFQSYYPASGWVEFDALEVWKSVLSGINNILKENQINPSSIGGVGITNQRESVVVWDKKTGKPLHPAISWQCKRSQGECDKIVAEGYTDIIRNKTGLFMDSYYSASKLKWLFNKHPSIADKASRDEIKTGTIDSWIIWNLTKGKSHLTDVSNASRTLLMNIRDLQWDRDLLRLWGVPGQILPEIKMSSDFFGYVDSSILSGNIPILGCIGDAQSAAVGQCAFEKYSAVNTYGTASNLDVNIGNKFFLSQNMIQTTIGWGIDDEVTYLLEGGVFTSGAVINWLKDKLRLIESGREADLIAEELKDNNGVYFVPAFVGLSAPHWDPYARGTIVGLSNNIGRKEIIRASLESIVYQVNDILMGAEKDINQKVKYLKVSGGVSRSDFILKFQADISNIKVIRSSIVNSTTLGAAFLAGLKSGLWEDKKQLSKISTTTKEFIPSISEVDRKNYISGWNKAISRSFNWLDRGGNEKVT